MTKGICDCSACTGTHGPCEPPPHVCPEPQVLVVNEEFMRRLQVLVDDMVRGDAPRAFENMHLILDKMEKGFRLP